MKNVRLAWTTFLVFFIVSISHSSQFHVTVSGSSSGDGSELRPWSLAFAFTHPAGVAAGDTIWVHGGEYRFSSSLDGYLTGTAARPIVVRSYPGERVVLMKTTSGNFFYPRGNYCWYWGLEFAYSVVDVVGQVGTPVYVRAVRNKFINCIMRDGVGTGIADQSESQGTEIYGCLVYHNGRRPEGSHGYGIYGQNATNGYGYKTYSDNFIFNNFGDFQIHNYTEGARIDSFLILRNVVGNTMNKATLLVGGGNPVPTGNIIDTNYFYGWRDPNWTWVSEFKEWGPHTNLRVRGNFFMQAGLDFASATTNRSFSGNTVYGFWPVYDDGVQFVDTASIPGNRWHIAQWPALPRRPAGSVVRYHPNRYEAGRGNLIVYNWDSLAAVQVSLAGIVPVGVSYRLMDVQNFYGPPIVQGTYSGVPITVPMTSTVISPPVTYPSNVGEPRHFDRKFGAFVLFIGIWQLNTPVVVSPMQGSVLPPDTVTFRWSRSLGASRYHMQVSTDSMFGSCLRSDSAVVDTFSRVQSLGAGRRLFVRVRGGAGMSWGSFSSTRSFSLGGGTQVFDSPGGLSREYGLIQNYPNPFNPTTTIAYVLPLPGTVRLDVFNSLGELIGTLEQGERQAGTHHVDFDASGLASGVYFYRLQASGFVETRRMVILK